MGIGGKGKRLFLKVTTNQSPRYAQPGEKGEEKTIWLRFKGGKGVATYLGILFVINLSYGIIFITIWIFIFILSKYSSLSSILATSSVPIFFRHLIE